MFSRRLATGLCGLLAGLSCARTTAVASALAVEAGEKPSVSVAAAANLKFALDDVIVSFRKLRPEVEVNVSYGASGSLLAQIRNGAPFDLFLSADTASPRTLAAEGLTLDGRGQPFALGHLVLWTRLDSGFDPASGLAGLQQASVRRIAIANPRHAPYGVAAEQALRQAGLWDSLQAKLVLGESVSQAAVFADQGAAQAGLISLSLALSATLQASGRFSILPDLSHEPLLQSGVVLKSARSPELARALLSCLLSPEGQAVLARYGYSAPQD